MEFNTCAKLVQEDSYREAEELYNKLLSEGKNPLQTMMDLQLNLQIELANKLPKYNRDPSKLETMGEVLDHIRRQEDAINDEMRELYTSLGRMSRGDKAATEIFKAWKQGHDDARNFKWNDLTPEDKLEILFEITDILHFIQNICIGLKMDAKDIFVLYYLKQRENMRRYNSGY